MQSESKSCRSLVLYCRSLGEVYYLEDEGEIKNVLGLFPKRVNAGYSAKLGLKNIALLNARTHHSHFLFLKDASSVVKEIDISPEDCIWDYEDGFEYYYFPPENMEKILSKMHRGVKNTETFEGQAERRRFVEGLRKDGNVLYIKLEPGFDIVTGTFEIYVPASKGESVDPNEVERELTQLYGDTQSLLWKKEKILNDFAISRPKRYIEETQEAVFEISGRKDFYEKIDKYRKSGFREDNYYKSVEYYTK
ncbi:MAG: hypothetical protein J5817_00555 [Treponema sp.]|nr:hypothetical protein [Treponema sp.]